MPNLDLDQLEALAAAVSEGTMEAAAGKLHLTPSAISQRIKALETTVGRVLLMRTRPLRPTSPGEKLLRLARQIEAIASDAARELGDEASEQPRVVALAVNADSLATWLMPALATVSSPIVFDLRRADETVTTELLRDGTVMGAVTASAQAVTGCTVQLLGHMRYRARATREFASRWFPNGPTTQQLAVAPVINFDRDDDLQDRYLRRRARRRLDPPRHYVPGTSASVQAVRLGLGWGMISDLQAEPSDGVPRLIELDPRGCFDEPLYWQQWRLPSAALDAVATAVRSHAARTLRLCNADRRDGSGSPPEIHPVCWAPTGRVPARPSLAPRRGHAGSALGTTVDTPARRPQHPPA
jgi:LysR family transcriptional regulator (chromosome initiation inhibitor)